MLQLLYIIAFTILALIAISNLIRNLLMFSFERDRNYSVTRSSISNRGNFSCKDAVQYENRGLL